LEDRIFEKIGHWLAPVTEIYKSQRCFVKVIMCNKMQIFAFLD
jgi:hypothetical protein